MNKVYKIALLAITIKVIILYGCTPEIQEFIDPIPIPTQGAKITTTSFAATWKPLLGARSYVVEVATDGSFDEEFLIEDTPTEVEDTFFVVNNVEVAQTYYYRLLARLSTGEQTRYSDIVTVNTLGMPSPLALNALQIGPTQFTAVWQKVNEAETYEIEVATDIKFANATSIQRLITTDTLGTIKEDLQVDQDYFYRVLATKGDIISGYSNVVHVTTTQLIKPTIAEVSDLAQTEFTFRWLPITGAVDYTVEITTDPLFLDANAFLIQDENITEAQYLAINLDANTTYYYRVRANNERSFSEYSDKGTVTTLPLEVPIALSGSSIQRNSFQANWQRVSIAESYKLDVATDEYFTQLVAGYNGLVLSDTSSLVTGLKQNTNYYYRVTALGLNASSVSSNIIQVHTPILAAPVLHEAINISSTSFTASWSPIADAENYILELSADLNFSTLSLTVDNIIDTLYDVEGLAGNETYYYRIRAKEGINYSSYSNHSSQYLAALKVPTNMTVSNVSYTGFVVSWHTVTDANYYTVDIATDNQFTATVTNYEEKIVHSASLIANDLENNTVYYVRVRAHNNYTASNYTETVLIATNFTNAPVAQQPITNDAYDIYASWSLIEDASYYLLDVATDAGFTTLVSGYENVLVEATYSRITNLQPSTTYYYRVRSVVEGSPSAYSNTVSVTTDAVPVQTALGTLEVENYSRSNGVERVYSETASGNYYLGAIHQNNTVNYEVNVPSTDNYKIEFRVSNNNAYNKSIVIKDGGASIRMVAVPPTGGWNNWQTVSVILTSFSSGYHDIQLEFTGGVGNEELLRLDWINIQPN